MPNHNHLTPKFAASIAPMALMAANSYRNTPVRYDLSKLGWRKIHDSGQSIDDPNFESPITGLAYDIFENFESNEKDLAVAVRGTDDLLDWLIANFSIGISPHYKSAFKHFRMLNEIKYPGRIKFVTGHSLGGGVSLGISVRFGIPAYAFSTSPRIFDGLGNEHLSAHRVAIYQKGDPLRAFWWLGRKVFKTTDNTIYRSEFDYSNLYKKRIPFISTLANNHYMNNLALGILSMGSKHDKRLQQILNLSGQKPIWP